jgi:hypothetical protein
MAQQHVFTSAPQGLKPGTRGFTTVGASRDITPTLVSRLELLSGYTLPTAPPTPAADAKSKFAPVNFMHVKLTVNGEKHTVVSRVAPTGVDYTGRSNTLAHHLLISKKEEPPAGPAWLALHSGLLMTQWTGQPRQLPSIQLPPGMAPGKPCETWGKVLGDPTYAGSLVAAIVNQPGRPIVIIHTPEHAPHIPEMLFEAMSILPPSLRWDVTFSTYFTSAAPDVHCRVRCILSTDPLADQVRRVASVVLLDLTQKTNGRPIAGEPFETCKKGGAWPNLNPTSDVAEETSDRVHPAAAKMLRAKPVPQLEDLILAELPDDPSGVHPPVAAPPREALARGRASRKDDMATYKAMALAAVAVIGSVSLVTFGAFYLFSSGSTPKPIEPSPVEAPVSPRPPVNVVDSGSIVPAAPTTVAPVAPTTPGTTPGSIAMPSSKAPTATPTGLAGSPGATDGAAASSGSVSPAGTFASKQLVPLQWAEFKIFDEGNSLYRKYQNTAAGIAPNLVRPLTSESNTLVARFEGPFPKGLIEASVFEVVINLPIPQTQLQASINSRNPTIAEVRRISTDISSDSTSLFSLSIEKQKDNKLMQLRIEPGAMSLENLVGASILIQPPTDNFAPVPEAKDKPMLVAFLSDSASRSMSFDIPVHLNDLDKSPTSLNTSQSAQFSRLKQWYLSPATPATLPAARWSEILLSLKQKPNLNQLPPEGVFIPVIMLASMDNPAPLYDVIVRPTAAGSAIRTFWDLRGELGRKKLAMDVAKASLKETVEAINALGSADDDRFHRLLPTASPTDIAKDLEADGRRVSSGIPVTPKLGGLLNKAKDDAKAAATLEKEYAASLAAFKSAIENISPATYEGLDVFGNVAATVTFNIDKTGQSNASTGPRTSITTPAPGTSSPSAAPAQ